MKQLVRGVCSLVLFSIAAVTYAGDEGTTGDANSELWLLAKYDSNGDHVISMSEVTNKRQKMFSYMDADADGIVSFDEYQGLDVRKRQLLLKARFNKLDVDHDGNVSADEYRSYLGSFEAIDVDGNGKITEKEMQPAKSAKAVQTGSSTRCLLWVCVRTSLD